MKENKLLRATGIIASLFGLLLILFGNIKTPENFRIFDIIQPILLFILILFIFLPDNRLMKVALIIGVFTVIIDYILETVAVYLDWWYPLGGTQFPPILIIPLEMLVGFLFIGAAIAIILTFPEKIREMNFKLLNWVKVLFKNPKFDWHWRVALMFLNALVGTNGDFIAGPEIWAPGPNWYPIYTFFVWFGGGIIILIIFYFLSKKFK